MPDDNNDPSAEVDGYQDGSYFSDAAELTHMLLDTRSTDHSMRSSYVDAQQLLDDFASRTNSGAWSASLGRAEVAQRLRDLVTLPADADTLTPAAAPRTGPRSLKQGGLNLCGPASFFQMALGRDPVAVIRCAIDLYETGFGMIGALTIAPDASLRGGDYGAMLRAAIAAGQEGFQAADWMLLGALRNSTSVFWQPAWRGDPDQELAGMTRPEELAGWMRASGIWAVVQDNGRWATNPGVVSATDIILYQGRDVALLVNTNLIAQSQLYNPNTGGPNAPSSTENNPAQLNTSFILSAFPDHWIVLLNEITPTADQTAVQLCVWTWGERFYLNTPVQVFIDNYYGSVIGQMAAPAQVN